jgi:CRP-like cAMP-binding protein
MAEERLVPDPIRPPNEFLTSLSEADYALLHPHLVHTKLVHREILFSAGGNITKVYFPTSGIVSLVVTLSEGESVEAGMIGRDGIVGGSAALDGSIALNEAIIQAPGEAATIDLRLLRDAVDKSRTLRQALYRFDLFALAQAQQSAACLAKHDVESRLCRWLLRAHDLHGDGFLPLTQEFIAQMLGVRRTSVSMVAGKLQAANFIRYTRGHIELVDMVGINDSACECYATINLQKRQLLGRAPN